jgi:hypothetical protein
MSLNCGAPLRNRTVDLLLTMHNSPGSLPDTRPGRPLASADLDLAPACGICAPSGHRDSSGAAAGAGSMPSQRQLPPAPGLPAKPGPWGWLPTSPVQAGGQETVRRSFLSRPPKVPKTALSSRFPTTREKFEPVPLSSPRRESPLAAQECCRAERHRGTCGGTESGGPGRQSADSQHWYARICR